MDELLQKLLESELLTEDTKTELKEAFDTKLAELAEAQREEIESEVKTTLAEKYAADKEALIDALDTKLDEKVEEEISELKEDIERFRDLEAEYAEKVVEARKEMSDTVKEDMKNVLEALDAYVEMRLSAEVEELRESIEEVRKEEHGRNVLKVIGEEYRRMFTEEEDVQEELVERQRELELATAQLRETQEKLQGIERDRKMDEVLESLHGHAREVMEAILINVPTNKLDEAYDRYIDRVLHESVSNKSSEKDDNVLAEGNEKEVVSESESEKEEELVAMNGDRQALAEDVSEEVSEPSNRKLDEGTLQRLRQLSGING